MTTTIYKQLASMQDFAQGVGKATQSRNGVNVQVDKVDTPFAVNSLAEMSTLPISEYTRARVYSDTLNFVDYIYDPTDTTGEPSTGPGTWIKLVVAKTFATVAKLKLSNLTAGQYINTKNYYDDAIGGGATYLVKTPAQAATDGDIVDELGNHTLNNGNIAVIQTGDIANIKQFGAKDGGTVDATPSIQAAIDSKNSIKLGTGTFLINPATPIKLKTGTTIKGEGQTQSVLLAMYDVAGSCIHREFTEGVANERVGYCLLEDFSVLLNHVHQASIPANIQIGFNLRDIGRSTVRNCYSGNARFGLAAILYPNATTKNLAMRGYPFAIGNRSASDPAYSGGEVNRIMNCRAWWARKGITLDDEDLTASVSAAYQTLVYGCDIQTVEVGINQGSQFNTGCTFEDNLIQDIQQASGSTNDTYVYNIGGYDIKVTGGYVETPDASLTAGIRFTSTANNNLIETFYHNIVDNKFVQDESSIPSENIVRQITEGDKLKVTEGGVEFRPARTKAYVVFDGSGNILNSHNVSSVVRNGVGDFNVNWSTDVNPTSDSCISINIESNVSANPVTAYLRSHSNNTSRVSTYNIQTSSPEDLPKTHVVLRG